MIAAIPASAPAQSSDNMVVICVIVLVVCAVGLVVWKFMGRGGGDGGQYADGTTGYDWLNTGAPTYYYPTAIPSQLAQQQTQQPVQAADDVVWVDA